MSITTARATEYRKEESDGKVTSGILRATRGRFPGVYAQPSYGDARAHRRITAGDRQAQSPGEAPAKTSAGFAVNKLAKLRPGYARAQVVAYGKKVFAGYIEYPAKWTNEKIAAKAVRAFAKAYGEKISPSRVGIYRI